LPPGYSLGWTTRDTLTAGNGTVVCINAPKTILTGAIHRLFIIEGAITAAISFSGVWLLPDTPMTTRWLTAEERQLADSRMESDKMGDEGYVSTLEGLKQAFTDKRTWVFCLMQNFHHAACSFNTFFPT
jgi:sugar phosphate permease